MITNSPLTFGGKTFQSRLFTGTGKFSSNAEMESALLASGSELVTVALKRVDLETEDDDILQHLKHKHADAYLQTQKQSKAPHKQTYTGFD